MIRRVENKSSQSLTIQSKTTLSWGNPKAWLLTLSFGLMANDILFGYGMASTNHRKFRI